MSAEAAAAVEALIYIRSTAAFIVPMRERLDRLHSGFMSIEDATWFLTSLGEIIRRRVEGERLAERLPAPEFVELVDILREAEVALLSAAASMRPVLAS